MILFLTESLHWGVALIPVIVLLAMFVWLDAFKLMNLKEVSVLLTLGALSALAAWPVSGGLLDTLPIGFSLYSRFVAPWIEEAIKAVIMIVLFRMNRIGYKLDAVISGFAIGAGFSVVENIFYLTIFPQYNTGTWLVRGFGTATMHGTTLAVLAAIAHEFAERETREAAGDFDFHLYWFIPGYAAAVALHTLFNQFPNRPLTAMMGTMLIAPLILIGILNFGTAEAPVHGAQPSAYVSDEWRLNERLSLTFGVRAEGLSFSTRPTYNADTRTTAPTIGAPVVSRRSAVRRERPSRAIGPIRGVRRQPSRALSRPWASVESHAIAFL